jgi:hypothetical protein
VLQKRYKREAPWFGEEKSVAAHTLHLLAFASEYSPIVTRVLQECYKSVTRVIQGCDTYHSHNQYTRQRRHHQHTSPQHTSHIRTYKRDIRECYMLQGHAPCEMWNVRVVRRRRAHWTHHLPREEIPSERLTLCIQIGVEYLGKRWDAMRCCQCTAWRRVMLARHSVLL